MSFPRLLGRCISITALALTSIAASADCARTAPEIGHAAAPEVGRMEIVAELGITPGNVAVSRDGRMFASVHGMRRGPAQLVEVFAGKDEWRPFPDEAWNAKPGSGPNVLNTAHGVAIDSKDRLWVIDHGNWLPTLQRPKLVAFDIHTKQLVYRHDFEPTVGPVGGILQDLAVDAERGFVYLADCGQNAAIVVVDVSKNTAWRFQGHPALQAENVDLVVEGQPLLFPGPDGKMGPARVPINPITLSADGETLFWGAMNGTTVYAAPARLFREHASMDDIGRGIRAVGKKPVSDGMSTDAEGNHFITNIGENAIDRLSPDGTITHLYKDPKFLWPDGVRFGPESWLYVSVNQLHRNPIFSGVADRGQPPYLIARIWTGTRGQVGR